MSIIKAAQLLYKSGEEQRHIKKKAEDYTNARLRKLGTGYQNIGESDNIWYQMSDFLAEHPLHDPEDPYRNLRYGALGGGVLGGLTGLLTSDEGEVPEFLSDAPERIREEFRQDPSLMDRLSDALMGAGIGAGVGGAAGYYIPQGITKGVGRVMTNIREPVGSKGIYHESGVDHSSKYEEKSSLSGKLNDLLNDKRFVNPSREDLRGKWKDMSLMDKLKTIGKSVWKDKPIYKVQKPEQDWTNWIKEREFPYRKGFMLEPRDFSKYNFGDAQDRTYELSSEDLNKVVGDDEDVSTAHGDNLVSTTLMGKTFVNPETNKFSDPWDFSTEGSSTNIVKNLARWIQNPVTFEGTFPEKYRKQDG